MFSALRSLFGASEQEALAKKFEEERKGSYPVSFEVSDLNFDHLRRKRAWIKGVNIQLTEEFDKEQLVGFDSLPDLLPLVPKDNLATVKYEELMKTTTSEEEQKAATATAEGTPDGAALFDYDNEDTASRNAFLDRFSLIQKRKIELKEQDSKPVAVIFNPYVSGDRAEEIRGLLYDRNIKNEVLTCEQQMDPFKLAFELEIDNFSAIIAVGGDGTFNQMINGMLARGDKKRLPVGLVPTGQANDFARSIGLSAEATVAAIEGIAKGEAVGVDTIRVLIDHDSESVVPTGEERMQYCRHMMSNASLSMPARIANGANTWKGCFGASAFSLSTYLQAFSCGFVEDTYQLTIDDQPVSQTGIHTALMMINNGKYTNGGMIINPFAAINDGLIDITWISDPAWQGTFGVTGVMSDARGHGGIQAYKGHSTYIRGKKIRIDVPQLEPEQPELELGDDGDNGDDGAEGTTPAAPQSIKQVIVVDGDALEYETSVAWEVFPSNVEILIDDSLFLDNCTFSYRVTAETERDRALKNCIEKIWDKYDVDKSGNLNKEETRAMLKNACADAPAPHNFFDESKFEHTFVAMDQNQNGRIEKIEMLMMMKAVVGK